MTNLPGGITTITGQPLVHSLNSAPGVAAFAFSSEEVSTVGASCPTTSCAAVARMQPDPVSVSRPQRLATIPVLLGSLTFAGFWSRWATNKLLRAANHFEGSHGEDPEVKSK